MQFDEDPECDYDLFRDLTERTTADNTTGKLWNTNARFLVAAEHPLDVALRTNDAALRCYYYEHGEAASWPQLTAREQQAYCRPPSMPETGLARGTYYIYGKGGSAVPVTETYAREHWIHSFQAR